MSVRRLCLSLLLVGSLQAYASATTILLNAAGVPGGGATLTPGAGLFSGQTVNNLRLTTEGNNSFTSLVDSSGAALPGVSVEIPFDMDRTDNDGWNQTGDTGDTAAHFDTAATTYSSEVANNFFWGRTASADAGDSFTVTINGLTPGPYRVGIVSASSRAANDADWYLNGALVADDLDETATETAPAFFPVTVSGSGALEIATNDESGGPSGSVRLLQALVVERIPEPASLALVGFGLACMVTSFRGRRGS